MNVWDDKVVNCCEAGTATANWLSGVSDSAWNIRWLLVTPQLWVQCSHRCRYPKLYPYLYNQWPQNGRYSHTHEKPYWCNFLRGSDIVEFLPSFGRCGEDLSGDIILIFSIGWLVLLPSKCFIICFFMATSISSSIIFMDFDKEVLVCLRSSRRDGGKCKTLFVAQPVITMRDNKQCYSLLIVELHSKTCSESIWHMQISSYSQNTKRWDIFGIVQILKHSTVFI